MNETRDLLERVGDRFAFPDQAFERLERRRDRKRRNRRIAAGAAGIAVFAALVFALARATWSDSAPRPGEPPPSPTPSIGIEHSGNPILRANEVVVDDSNSIEAVDPETRDRRTLVACEDPCIFFSGAAVSADDGWLAYTIETCLAAAPCEAGRRPLGRERSRGTPSTDPELRSGPVLPAGVGMVADERHARGRRTRRRSVGPAVAVPGRSGDGWPNRDRGSGHGRRDARVVPRRIVDRLRRCRERLHRPPRWRSTDVAGGGSAPRWSPDGSHVAVTVQDGISIVTADGSDEIRIANGDEAAWSPDGLHIVTHVVGVVAWLPR